MEAEAAQIERIVRTGLGEDLGDTGDVTTLATIPEQAACCAVLLAKAAGVVAGFAPFEAVFRQLDERICTQWEVAEGAFVAVGTVIAHVSGPARSSERLALNLVQRMSGIATRTRAMVDAIGAAGVGAVLLDTRKTAPGLRVLDRAAVVLGGGHNHRAGLYDAILIKDNHIAIAGGIGAAFTRVSTYLKVTGRPLPIVIEVCTLDEVDDVLALGDGAVARILLDNMVAVGDDGDVDTSALCAAVARIAGRLPTEASGGVTAGTVGAIAQAGVDFVSCGALTHSVQAMDLSLERMEGADQTRLRAFLGDLRDELHHARTDFDQDVLVLCPGPPDKPDLRRLKQQQRRRSTLRHRPESTPTPSEFEALKQGVAQLTDTSAIEAVEQRMRQAGDPFVTQVACERRRLQLAAGAVQAALARFESAASCVDGSRV